MESNISTYTRKKDGGWQYIISYKDYTGKWIRKAKQGFKSKGEANRAMLERLPEIEKLAKSRDDNNMTFEEFFHNFIQHERLYKEFNTLVKYRNAFSNCDHIKDMLLKEITDRDIQRLVDNMLRKGLASSSIKTYMASVRVMFASAKDEYKLIEELPSFKYKIKDNKETKIKKALTNDEIEKMLIELKDNKYYLIILTALKTGMRLGEILGLCWEDVDFENNEIIIDKQYKNIDDDKFDLGSLKTNNSNRIIPLPLSLREVLEPLKGKGRIFAYKNNKSLSLALNKALKPYNVTMHELRHTYATTLIANGFDFKTVAYFMGHDVAMLMKLYSHYTNDMRNKAISRINNIL